MLKNDPFRGYSLKARLWTGFGLMSLQTMAAIGLLLINLYVDHKGIATPPNFHLILLGLASFLAISSVLVMVLWAVILAKTIKTSLTETINALEKAGNGDLRVHLSEAGRDELSMLAAGFNWFVENIVSLIEKAKSHGDQVSDKTTHAAQQSQNTATSIANALVSLEQIANGVTQSTETAQRVQAEFNNVQATSKVVVQQISGAADAVQELASSSQQINDLTRTISDIAEKTNLLALNASIEAARAGDAGRGFAVVAEEVAKLAHDTEKSTKEVYDKVAHLLAHTQEVTIAVEEAKQQLELSSKNTQSVQVEVTQQAESMETLNRNLQPLRQSLVQESEKVQALAGTMHDLQQQTDTLHQELTAFKLNA